MGEAASELTSLSQRAASGVKWSLGSQGARQVVRILTLVALTRLIGPRDFGLMSMALVVTGFLDLFRDMGTADALIQRRQLTKRLLSTTFWANLAFGLTAGAVMFSVAPFVADFYRSPRLTPVVQLMALSFVVSGLGTVHQAILARNLAFHRLAVIETGATLAGSATAIGVAVGGGGVYCLVAQMLVNSSLITIGTWLASGWRPSFQFAVDDLRSIRRFTSNLVGFNTLNYLTRNVDYLLIGRYLGAESLGYYTLAYNLLLFPLSMLTYSIARVAFPAYSSIQDDPARIGRAYLRVTGFIASISFPMMLGLVVLCDVFVDVVYGKAWSPAIPVIAVLAPVGMFQSITSLCGGIYKSRARTDLQLKWEVVVAIFVIASFWIGLHWGIVGVAAAYAIAEVVLLGYPTFAIPLRLIGLRVSDLARAISRPMAASVVMVLAVLAARSLIGRDPGAAGFAVLVALGACVYLAVSLVINRRQLREIILLVRPAPKPDQLVVAGR